MTARSHKQDEELFSILAKSSPIGIYIVQGGVFQFVNQQFQRQTGYNERGLLGTDPLHSAIRTGRQPTHTRLANEKLLFPLYW